MQKISIARHSNIFWFMVEGYWIYSLYRHFISLGENLVALIVCFLRSVYIFSRCYLELSAREQGFEFHGRAESAVREVKRRRQYRSTFPKRVSVYICSEAEWGVDMRVYTEHCISSASSSATPCDARDCDTAVSDLCFEKSSSSTTRHLTLIAKLTHICFTFDIVTWQSSKFMKMTCLIDIV